MFNLKTLAESVQKNCHISDAQYAGQYTLCIFLLKMREYYRWEKAIPQSHALPKQAVGDWLTERENYWDKLASLPLEPLTIAGQTFGPFDSEAINARLTPLGYVYSGGIGIFHKPYFFLGKLETKSVHNELTLLVSSKEYARDLVAPPAMLQGNTVFIRKESLRRMIWERIEEWRMKQQANTPLARALGCYTQHIPTILAEDVSTSIDMEHVLDQMTDNELESVFLHELGEAQAKQLLGKHWEELLAGLPRSKAEFIVRAVRDHLADSLSTLPRLLAMQNEPALHFYFANFIGMRRELYPEALQAYQDWVDSGNLAPLEDICQQGQRRWLTFARQILDLYSALGSNENLVTAIERLFPKTQSPH